MVGLVQKVIKFGKTGLIKSESQPVLK